MRTNKLNDKELESIRRVFQLIDEECDGKAQAFADKTGIGKSSISHYKHQRHAPNQDHAYLISKAFNINPMWVMGFDVPKETIPKPKLPPTPRDEENSAFSTQLLLDKPLQEALIIYFTLSPEEKQHIISTIHLIGKRKQEGQS